MKAEYFQALDFECEISELDFFEDFGYVLDIFQKTKDLFETLGMPHEEDDLRRCGINVDIQKQNSGGFHMPVNDYPFNGSRTSYIYYSQFQNESLDLWNRAHEEAHAVCHFGLRGELERRMGGSNLGGLHEEDFCDNAGLFVLKKRGIEPHPNILIPYKERVARSRDKSFKSKFPVLLLTYF